MPSRVSRRILAGAFGGLLVAPGLAAAADRPTAAQLDTTQQIAQSALRKVALLERSLDGLPAPDPARAGSGGIVRVTAAQLRTNQRIAQAAIRRAAAIEARLAGRPAPAARPGKGDVIRLTARQAAITRRIAVVAMRRASALAERIPYQHLAVEIELPDFVAVRSVDLHDAGHAAVGMLVGDRPAVAVRFGPLGRWTTGTLASMSGDQSVGVPPTVRVNAHGAALAVWSNGAGEFVAARRQPGGKWTRGVPVGLPRLSAVELGDDGTAWAIGDGGKVRRQADPQAAWSAPFADTLVPGNVALDGTGRAVAAWTVDTDAASASRTTQIFAATLGSTGWGTPELLAGTEAGTTAGDVAVALGENGDAGVTWGRFGPSASADGLQAASRPAGGSWGAPVDVRPRGIRGFGPSIAIGDGGAMVVAWREFAPIRALAATRPAGAASFGAPVTLLAIGTDDSEQNVETTVFATGATPTVLLKTEGHGATVNWAAAQPDGALVRVPSWAGGTDEAAAVAAGGAILAAGPAELDQRALHIESRGTD
jgi:hypothetical protein